MMTEEQFYFLKLGEECAEVAHRCSKLMQFGADDLEPGQKQTNQERLEIELLDLSSVVMILQEKGLIERYGQTFLEEYKSAKKAKIEHFLRYSQELGRVERRPT